jgi:drug/metabolite transporter (DMT)-like permease
MSDIVKSPAVPDEHLSIPRLFEVEKINLQNRHLIIRPRRFRVHKPARFYIVISSCHIPAHFPPTIFAMIDSFTRHRPTFQVLSGAFMISFSAVFVKLANVSPTASGFYRVFFGFFFLLAVAVWRDSLKKPSLRQSLLIFFCGLTFALDLFFWHVSIMYIGPGLATLLGNFQVFLLAAVGILFYKEAARLRFLFAIPLAVFGLLLIIGLDWSTLGAAYKTGLCYGLVTALCYTVFLLCLRKLQADGTTSLFASLMLVSLCCAIFLGLKMVHTGDSFAIPDLKSLLALVGLGLFCQTIGWLLIANAMPRIQASFTGLILLLQPALSFIWDVVLFDRPTDLLNWTGVFLTLTAIYMGVTGKKSRS